MKICQTLQLDPHQEKIIFDLWNNEYPQTLSFAAPADLDAYLKALIRAMHYFALSESGAPAGWAVSFERDQEIRFAIIVNSAFHKQGIGSRLLNALKQNNRCLNGWAIDHERGIRANGASYASPLPFYLKHNFIVKEDIRLETEKLSAVKIHWNGDEFF